jgi:hypothetical protein
MPHDKRNDRGNNPNDPDESPADIADHQQRNDESREEQAQTGGQHDDQGHTPKVPAGPGKT